MKRSEAYHILGKMWENATAEQAEALSIAQEDIEFVDLMPEDMVAVVRCKDCKRCRGFGGATIEPDEIGICKIDDLCVKPNDFCSYGERRTDYDRT